MPIGVPRIIYCWGEELPPQWTDIYNFIFRRRMVFLMQYLDDELCNQICGLLINIHMEDRSKELEKKEIEKSGIFKSAGRSSKESGTTLPSQNIALNEGKKLKKDKSMEDLLSSYGNSIYEEDLAIDENYTLEQYTLQKITLEWLNWNAQFFDYSDEPYLFYLAEILSKDFKKDDTQLFYQTSYAKTNQNFDMRNPSAHAKPASLEAFYGLQKNSIAYPLNKDPFSGKQAFKATLAPFRSILNLANLISKDKNFSINNLLPDSAKIDKKGTSVLKGELLQQFNQLKQKPGLAKLIGSLASKDFLNKQANPLNQLSVQEKVLGQRNLRREYAMDKTYPSASGNFYSEAELQSSNNPIEYSSPPYNNKAAQLFSSAKQKNRSAKALNYLDFDSTNGPKATDFKNRNDYSRKQTKRALQEEESKKVFVIINSFGGSVGNGITVHDALQFIKAGSLTLGLGVAASAASLVLAGGTISERYVTEGCHVMIHQPEGGLNGQASDIWIDSQEIMKIRLDVAEIYSLSAHRPRHKILRDLDRDFYLTATETIHYGLADEIATNEVMHEIIEMTSKVWDYHDSKQQRLLETRDSASSGLDTQTQN
uniref:ATP-dependent Clp protease proteolytic subunit n=1 Tax=Chloromonas radiata TaxID=47907 RepID=A0A0S2ICQ1_9CHLO|nr:proteolytic subunit 2 of clp protease [Chloromonas radiata]